GAAAQHSDLAIFTEPGATIGGRAGVIGMPTIFYPLPHIAVHIVKAERVGFITRHRRGAAIFSLPRITHTRAATVEARHGAGEIVAPRIFRTAAGACGVFPLRFTGQAVALTRQRV